MRFNYQRIRQAREEAGLKQQELAFLLGWKRQQLNDIERGIGCPTVKTLLKIFDALNIQDAGPFFLP